MVVKGIEQYQIKSQQCWQFNSVYNNEKCEQKNIVQAF